VQATVPKTVTNPGGSRPPRLQSASGRISVCG
jgi:hypothetical protein